MTVDEWRATPPALRRAAWARMGDQQRRDLIGALSAQTPNYGLRYPVDYNDPADTPLVMGQLASDTDTALGLMIEETVADARYAPAVHHHPTVIHGPYGPLNPYETIQAINPAFTPYSQQLHHSSPNDGITQLIVQAYLNVDGVNSYSRNSLSAYLSVYGRWHDNLPVEWTGEQTSVALGRLTVVKPVDYGYASATASRFFRARPGMRGSFGAAAAVDNPYDGGATARFGYIRVTLVHYPAADLGSGDSWGIQ